MLRDLLTEKGRRGKHRLRRKITLEEIRLAIVVVAPVWAEIGASNAWPGMRFQNGPEGSLGEPIAPAADRSGRVPIVVVTAGSTQYGIRVDELEGQQEVVIKPLPSQFGQLPGLAGATIMGDGSVVFILDPASLYDFVVTHASTTMATAS